MKKVLLATTMLVAGASVAAADVTLSGDARMGLHNKFQFDNAQDDPTFFTSRARVMFTMSGESDSGLSFGASFRAHDAVGASNGTKGSVFIQGAFGKLSMGDVDGAANAAVGHIDGVGLTGLDDTNEFIYIANGAADLPFGNEFANVNVTGDPSVLYEYTFGSFSLYASATQPAFSVNPAGAGIFIPGTYEGDAYALGASYTIDNYKVSLGFERLDLNRVIPATPRDTIKIDHLVLGGDATFGDFTVKARYGEGDVEFNGIPDTEVKQTGLSATYTMDAISVTAFYSKKEFSLVPAFGGGNLLETESVGLGASYDLGGGAKVVGGVVRASGREGAEPKVSDTAFDLGVALTF